MSECIHVFKQINASQAKWHSFQTEKIILQPEGMWLQILILSFYKLGMWIQWFRKQGWESMVRMTWISDSQTTELPSLLCVCYLTLSPCPNCSFRQAPFNSVWEFLMRFLLQKRHHFFEDFCFKKGNHWWRSG